MKQTLSINGPRSWATLIIVGGAALSFPFLRKEQTPTANPSHVAQVPDYSQQSWPDVRVQQLESEQKQPSTLTDEDWNDLAQLQRSKASNHQGNPAFPSTAPLPKWADHGARVDQIVSANMNRPPLPSEAPNSKDSITPFSTWVDPRLSSEPTQALLNCSATDALHATNNDSDSRWEPETTRANGGSLASGTVVKPFETRPNMWPDELKMQNQSSAQIAAASKSFADKNVVAYQPWNEHREPIKPSMVSTTIAPGNSGLNNATSSTSDAQIALPSPSTFNHGGPQRVVQFQQPPQTTTATTSTHRAKHFIQQPTKAQGQR